MIAQSYIKRTLRSLNSRYSRTNSQRDAFFYSKLALLELCGWIEQSMDNVVLCSCNRTIKDPKYKRIIEDKVDRVYGFDYKTQFREMLISLHGLRAVMNMERALDASKFEKMKGALTQLKGDRNSHAHTHVSLTIPSHNAPSTTLKLYKEVKEGLIEIETYLRKNGL